MVLARYKHNSNERGLLLGMKQYKKSQAEYERSVKTVRQLSDLEKRLRVFVTTSDMQRIHSIPAKLGNRSTRNVACR
jgi:hypothetical protein